LQQYRHKCDVPTVSGNVCYRCLSGLNTDVVRQPPLTHLRHWSVVEWPVPDVDPNPLQGACLRHYDAFLL